MLQPPRQLRDTLELLSRLDAGFDLDGLAKQIDWQGVTPQQISCATLGRLPQDMRSSGLLPVAFEPSDYFKALLLCPEFQSGIVPAILNAYPEKPRNFFVHIPRCGGTSFSQTLAAQTCAIHYNDVGSEWCSGHAFVAAVAEICRKIQSHEAIHVSGHYTVRSLVDGRLARSGDSVWTSVRPPHEIILSYVNYVLTILEADPDLARPDARIWAAQLGLDRPPGALAPERLRAALGRMIRNDTLLPRNLLCHFLGDGTAASAFDLLAAADVEVIATSRLDQWREQRWKLPRQPRANVSRNFIRWDTLDSRARRQVSGLIRQDITLHRVIAASLGDATSRGGMEIARSSVQPASSGRSAQRRVQRASRRILVDPEFVLPRPAGGHDALSADAGAGWAQPPLNYRTIETTMQLPLIQARIRVRYARRRLGWFEFGVRPRLERLGMMLGR